MRSGALVVASLLLGGCVGARSGIDSTVHTVRARTGVDIDGDADDVRRERDQILAEPLSRDAAARLAILGSPRAQVALARVGIARAELVRALALPNPHAEGAIRFTHEHTVIDLDALIGVTHLVLMPFKEAAASDDLEAASLLASADLVDAVSDAQIAFVHNEAAREILELRRQSTFALAQTSELARRLADAGNVPDLVALTERAAYEDARLVLARTEQDATVSRLALSSAMGLDGGEASRYRTPGKLAALPDKAPPSTHDAARVALKNNLELRALEKGHAAAAKRADAALAEGALPRIEAGVSAEYEGEWGVGPALSLGLPLFYQGQGEVDAEEARMLAARGSHASLVATVDAEARAAADEVVFAFERARFVRDTLLPLRQRILEETQLQYNAMSEGAFRLVAAKRDEIETRAQYVMAVRDYFVAELRLTRLLAGGRPMGGAPASLSTPGAPAARAPSH